MEDDKIEIKNLQGKFEKTGKILKNLDKKLTDIAPTVDKFLEFKRFDKDSIVISNLKRELEKNFSDYFCKDSDVFGLTKS